MGSDKALLPFRGSTFLNHLVSLFLPRVDPLVVVLGHHADLIRKSLSPDSNLRVAVNSEYRRGMLSSMQTGIRALPAECGAALITLVDLPLIQEATVDRLLTEFAASGKLLAIPRCGDRRGHPIVVARKILEEFLQLAPEDSPKDVVRGHRDETLFVDVDDPGILRDIDLPSEYEQWVGKT
jgi:molybdenum cofactor cytidylyltransferase